jgi:probable rRNA maturation factor
MAAAVRVQYGAALSGHRDDELDRATVRRLLGRAVRAALREDGVRTAELSVTLLADAEIADMNRQFLAHAGPTDVISFPLYDDGEDPVGDIYIGYEQALRQAAAHDVAAAEELVRLAVHGVLHVLGHEHPDGDERVASAMWRMQERIVARVMAG